WSWPAAPTALAPTPPTLLADRTPRAPSPLPSYGAVLLLPRAFPPFSVNPKSPQDPRNFEASVLALPCTPLQAQADGADCQPLPRPPGEEPISLFGQVGLQPLAVGLLAVPRAVPPPAPADQVDAVGQVFLKQVFSPELLSQARLRLVVVRPLHLNDNGG